jgi:hypothetical protein
MRDFLCVNCHKFIIVKSIKRRNINIKFDEFKFLGKSHHHHWNKEDILDYDQITTKSA